MRKCVLLILVLTILIISSCSDPPVESVVIKDPKLYMNVNSYVNEKINTISKGVLPSSGIVEKSECIYEYHYDCSLWGDPSFLVYLNSKMDSNIFVAEIERVSRKADQAFDIGGEKIIYNFSEQLKTNLERYADDEILDGTTVIFELCFVNYTDYTIEYLFVMQSDSYGRSDIISKLFDKFSIYDFVE